MKVLIGTYGKTWHFWQVDRGDKLPLGIPQLMMGFTADGQAKASIIAERDKLYTPSAAKKAARGRHSGRDTRSGGRRVAKRPGGSVGFENSLSSGEMIMMALKA